MPYQDEEEANEIIVKSPPNKYLLQPDNTERNNEILPSLSPDREE